ncbi:MAG: amidohydrolase [Acidobacteriota bacterium]
MLRLSALLSTFLIALTLPAGAQEAPADLVVLNGKILTVDSQFSQAEAAAVRDGVFVAVGSNADIRRLVGDGTRVIDAQGRTVIPGLIETHVHATGAARREATAPFIQLGSIAEIQEWVGRQAGSQPKGTWIQIPRADVTRIQERRIPTRQELDEAATEHPVVFNWQYANHQIQVLNSAALAAAGIRGDTPAGERGKIELTPDGNPTGVLENASFLVSQFLERPEASESEYLDSLNRLLRRYNELGITSIFERNSNAEGYQSYERLKAEDRLPVRVTVTIGLRSDGTVEDTERFIRSLPFSFGDGDDWLRVGPLKIGVDGGILYGTAFMREPYGRDSFELYRISDPEHRGSLRLSPDQLKNIIGTGHRLGWQMSSHVTGDAGVDAVLDAVEAIHQENPISSRRYTLIHAYFANPQAARRAARLGVCVDTQPAWYYKDGDALAQALGPARLNKFIGLAQWREEGVKVALNSDHMQGFDPDKSLNPYNPFLTLYTAVTRKTEYGQVLGKDQRISRPDALRMLTIDAAYLGFDESRKGSIEVGKLADLALLSDDLMTCDAEAIKNIRAHTTIVGGRVLYEAGR